MPQGVSDSSGQKGDLTEVEDDDDQKAAKAIMTEVGGDDEEFETDKNKIAEDIFQELTPIEQYALTFVQRENIEKQKVEEELETIRDTEKLARELARKHR